MKIRKLCILVLVALLLVSGCQELSFLRPIDTANVYDDSKYVAEYSEKWQYSLLDRELKSYYGSLYTAVTETAKIDSVVDLTDKETSESAQGVKVYFPNAEMTKEQIVSVYEAFFRDNPQFFFLDRTYQLEGLSSKDGKTTYNTLILRYYMTRDQRVYLSKTLESAVNEIMADCPQSDDYQKELYLHDQLAYLCTYDKQAADLSAETVPDAYTAFGALVKGAAVCEGYAKAMQLLLQKANIPCTLVTGKSGENDEAHMWNLVKINGNNYHLDPTWNDSENGNYHTYFNLTTGKISATHRMDDNQEWIPKCTATTDNYFIRNNTFIDTYERQKIAKIIAQQVEAEAECIQLSFADGKFENGLLFLKNSALTTQYVNEHLSGKTFWKYSLWVDAGQQVLTITKK